MDDLLKLRKEFSRVNKKDPQALRQWFEKHPYFTTNDHAQIADASSQHILDLKKRAGLGGTKIVKTPTNIPLKSIAPILDIPSDWRYNKEWLEKVSRIYSVPQIAKAVGRHRRRMYMILIQNGIKPKNIKEALKSKNPCCNHEWCYRHYITLGYSQEKCASLAGIRRQTFADWLNRFKIVVRDAEQTSRGRRHITLWEKRFIYELRQQSVVRRVYVREGYIHVRFRDYFWENYYPGKRKAKLKRPYTYFHITPETTRIDNVPAVYHEYGVGIDGAPLYPAHIAISPKEFKAASFMEQRLALHEFARQIITRGWIWPSYPLDVLTHDFDRIKNFNMAKYLEDGGFTAIPKVSVLQAHPGRKLMLHFFDTSKFWEVIGRPRLLTRFLNRFVGGTTKINLLNLLLAIAVNEGAVLKPRKLMPRIPDPVVYHAIFKRLGLTGTIMDLEVGLGNRALAAAAAGLTYTTPDPSLTAALDRGLADLTGLQTEPFTGQHVDTMIYDNGWRAPQMDKVLPYLGIAKRLLVFAPYNHREEVMKYNPKSAIKLRTRLRRRPPDLLFTW